MNDTITTLIFTCLVCALPLIAVGGAIGFVYYRTRRSNEGSDETAAALGLEKKVPIKKVWWYEGELAGGRRLGLMPIAFTRQGRSFGGDRRRTYYDPAVRLVIELFTQAPSGLRVVRLHTHGRKNRPLDTFESAFDVKGGEALSEEAKAAMIEFVDEHEGALWLEDRQDVPAAIFSSAEMMDRTSAVLIHEYKAKKPELDVVEAKTAALVRLADLIEQSLV